MTTARATAVPEPRPRGVASSPRELEQALVEQRVALARTR
jgi:hypothetical protein